MPPLAVGIILISTVIHVGWNLAVKQHSASWTAMLRLLASVSIPGVLILLWAELFATGLLIHVWPLVVGAGFFQAIYFLGLTLGYRSGDLSVMYPVTRALPVLFMGGFDLLRRLHPSALGWIGLALVMLGCIVISRSAGQVSDTRGPDRFTRWLHPTVGWATMAAAGTVGYTVLDKLAAEVLERTMGGGIVVALHYGIGEIVISTAIYAPLLLITMRISDRRSGMAVPAVGGEQPEAPPQAGGVRGWHLSVIGVGVFVAYSLVLWAYQLSERVSYVVALRQFSIVLGMVAGVVLMREDARFVRVASAVVITAGIALVSVAP